VKPAPLVAVFISSLLMGVTHPWAKRFLLDGTDLLPFTFLYVAVRVIAQLPFTFTLGGFKLPNRSQVFWLLGFGLVGGFLRIFELIGISKGVPVAMVTFLVYSHPIWTILLARVFYNQKTDRTGFVKLALAVTGVVFIAGLSPLDVSTSSRGLIAPICAGFLVAIWIVLSREIQKRGCTVPTISICYDLISLCVVAVVALPEVLSNGVYLPWAGEPSRWFELVLFGFISGVIPNFLFYYGAKSLPPTVPALLLLFDPVFSAVLAAMFWNDKITSLFLAGACLIMLTNLPDAMLSRLGFALRKVTWQDIRQLVRVKREKHAPAQPSSSTAPRAA
jgi:drug/metabolite transporter (DMT)-like permease